MGNRPVRIGPAAAMWLLAATAASSSACGPGSVVCPEDGCRGPDATWAEPWSEPDTGSGHTDAGPRPGETDAGSDASEADSGSEAGDADSGSDAGETDSGSGEVDSGSSLPDGGTSNADAGAGDGSQPPVPANLVIDGNVVEHTINGIGSNVNAWSWKNGELRPALDALVDSLGHSIFRVAHDRMEWAGGGSTRPAATLAGLQSLFPATLRSVYEAPDMQDLWNTIGYLNSKGVGSDQIMVNFMGWTAPWMGGSGRYGVVSHITNNAQTNQDIATMLASLVYYGHHRRDVSGANSNLSFGYLAPFNETDWNGLEGPQVAPAQMNTIYANILAALNAMGDTTTKLVGPDTAAGPDSYGAAFSAGVLARMAHLSFHTYSGSTTPAVSRGGVPADWLTETSKWCSGCDNNQPPAESEWAFGADIGEILLDDLRNGFSAVLTWEAFDTFYYHHDSYSAWGHVGCTQGSGGCTTSDATPRLYTIRDRAWAQATLARAARPGMSVRGVTTTLSNLKVLALYDPAVPRFSLVGYNTGSSATTINARLQNLSVPGPLAFQQTNASSALTHVRDVPVSDGAFSVTVPANTFFYVSDVHSIRDTTPPSPPTGLRSLGSTPTTISLSWNDSTDDVGVSGYRVLRNGVQAGTTSSTSFVDTALAPSTSYTYTVVAFDGWGNSSEPSPAAAATTTVAQAGALFTP